MTEQTRCVVATELAALLGSDGVVSDASERAFFSQDLFSGGHLPLAIARPGSTELVAELVKYCRREKLAIFPRGGGMSYTDAFQPTQERSIILDFSRLQRIREISTQNGHVTVEAGCTWAALDAALAAHDVRSRFWGPMSGLNATIGGSMSQGSVTFGSGQTGASATAVKSFEVVTGCGDVVHSGSDGSIGTTPFNRNFGPDLTGIFANDAGALGIKTAITLEIEPRPAKVSGISFACDDFAAMAELFNGVLTRRLASELIAMDGEFARQNAGPADWRADALSVWRVGRAAGSPLAAIVRVARIAIGGRRFLEQARFTVHFVVEARDSHDLRSRLAAIRDLSTHHREIVNTLPLMIRANPFPALAVTHADGRRILPIHGIFPFDAVSDFHRDYGKLKEGYAPRMHAQKLSLTEFFAGVAGVGMLYEPMFIWPDSLTEYHRRMMPPYLQGKIAEFPENLSARALVQEMTSAIIALMRQHGSSHFQIGRLYPYAQQRDASSQALLRQLKALLDPDNIVNPGALGL